MKADVVVALAVVAANDESSSLSKTTAATLATKQGQGQQQQQQFSPKMKTRVITVIFATFVVATCNGKLSDLGPFFFKMAPKTHL